MKSVLVLGAGLVTGPMVKYLLEAGYHVTVASRTASKAEALVGNHPHGEAVAFDIQHDGGDRPPCVGLRRRLPAGPQGESKMDVQIDP